MDEIAEGWKEIGKKNIDDKKSRLSYWIETYLFYNSVFGIFVGMILILIIENIVKYGFIDFMVSYSMIFIGVGFGFAYYFNVQ